MIWFMLLAHFIGDFPLQPDWMVRRKSNFWVLLLHVSIHFVLMMVLVGSVRIVIWPFLFLLNLVHLVQDYLKILLTNLRPNRIVFLFFADQVLHSGAIFGTVVLIKTIRPEINIQGNSAWPIIAIAYLVVSYTWYISERVINYANTEYLQDIKNTKIPRMFARSGFVSLFFLARAWMPEFSWLVILPYPNSAYRKQALISDLSISSVVIIFLLATLGWG